MVLWHQSVRTDSQFPMPLTMQMLQTQLFQIKESINHQRNMTYGDANLFAVMDLLIPSHHEDVYIQ